MAWQNAEQIHYLLCCISSWNIWWQFDGVQISSLCLFLHWSPNSFFLCFLLCQEVCFLLFSFFLVSNYPLFSDTVKPLRGTNVSFANSHFTFTLKKYQPDGFKKMPIMSNILFEIKVPLQNASHVINCLKLYVALWMHEKLRIPSLY